MIWKKNYTIEQINQLMSGCAIDHLGIEVCAMGDDWIEAKMPIDQRTRQPFGWLHGGVSVVLAETLGSLAGFLTVEEHQIAVGQEINANHLRPTKEGWVSAKTYPLHLGRKTQVWQIDIRNDQAKLCCVSRLTVSIIDYEDE